MKLLFAIFVVFTVFLVGCSTVTELPVEIEKKGSYCARHSDCLSGICKFETEYAGNCVPPKCEPGVVFPGENCVAVAEGADCALPTDCESGVCDHYKADLGKCAPIECVPGTLADNNNVYCDKTNKWQSTKLEGESCEESYECFKQTCFMIPDCKLTDIPNTVVSCENNRCASRIEKAECEQQGLKTVLAKHEFMPTDDGACIESFAQRELDVVCAPCGNGVCDEVESKCNCPLDCQ